MGLTKRWMLFLCLTACSAGDKARDTGRESIVASVLPTLSAAHDAYLKGDWLAVGERVRDVLLSPASTELARENALEVLDRAYEANSGSLPSRFKLPRGIEGLAYGQIAGVNPGGPISTIFIRGEGPGSTEIKNLTVRKSSGEVLLDKASAIGDFTVEKDDTGPEFELEADVATLPSDGVFTVRIELTSGEVSEGFFIARRLTSSASPVITAPLHGAVTSDPNPMVRWLPFRSPERQPFERRNLGVYVSRQLPAGRDNKAWAYFTSKPDELDSIRIGDARGGGESKLSPGDHWLALTLGEVRTFGPMRIVRRSRMVTSLRIVP